MISIRHRTLALLLGMALPVTSATAQDTQDPPPIAEKVAKATELAGSQFAQALFLCRDKSFLQIQQWSKDGYGRWYEPARLFDNFYYIGHHFVGVAVLKTSAGLILFDSGAGADEAKDHIVPGLVKLGLDPKDVKLIVVTHGHGDHFGGARWFQDTYGTPIGLSAADWDLVARLPADSPEIGGRTAPRRDRVITDGEVVKLGTEAVKLYITPGHTPGTVSAIFTVYDHGRPHVVSLFGGTAFPGTIEPTTRTGGLAAHRASLQRFAALSKTAGADVIFNTHLFAFGGGERLDEVIQHGKGSPFLVGKDAVARYYGAIDYCVQAAEARIQVKQAAPN